MTREQKIATLLARQADDQRRLALDGIDASARKSKTFGSKEHRAARDEVEKIHDTKRHRYEGFTDDQLDDELLRPRT